MQTPEHAAWTKAVDEELDSMNKNGVWELDDRPKTRSYGGKVNIIDSKWVFKRKVLENGKTKFRTRLLQGCYSFTTIPSLVKHSDSSRLPQDSVGFLKTCLTCKDCRTFQRLAKILLRFYGVFATQVPLFIVNYLILYVLIYGVKSRVM